MTPQDTPVPVRFRGSRLDDVHHHRLTPPSRPPAGGRRPAALGQAHRTSGCAHSGGRCSRAVAGISGTRVHRAACCDRHGREATGTSERSSEIA